MNKKRTRKNDPIAAGTCYRPALLPAMLMAAVGCANTAWAVDGGVIAAGAGAIKTQGNKTTISQSSDKMVVNWKNFDIAKDQSVVVNQPGVSSAVLNRVTTASPTQIDGTLKANGRVFVVNPAGVVFGSGAKVDVGSLVASTLDARDQDFMNGGTPFAGNYRLLNLYAGNADARVTNNGKLVAQESVTLLGPQVVNAGTIRAKDVTLGAANGAAMLMNDSNLRVILGKQAQNALVSNYGVIAANGGNVQLSTSATGAVLGTVIQNAGRIEATSASAQEGGTISLTSMDGGKISVGGRLSADNGISIRSEGQFGGILSPSGTVLDPAITRARVYSAPSTHDVTVESGAKLQSQRSVDISSDGGHIRMNGLINAANDVSIDSTVLKYGDMGPEAAVGMITTNGRINSGTATLMSSAIDINAPIKADKQIYVESYYGDLNQRANIISAGGSVNLLSGGSISQAAGVKTSAAGTVALDTAWRQLVNQSPAGKIRSANIVAKTISITGNDVTLAGNLKADGDISVKAKYYDPPCPNGSDCTTVMQGGPISQTGNVISSNGNVTLDASTSITQDSHSRTSAANAVTLNAARVYTGKIDAGKQININANSVSLGGKLVAPEINLPVDARNAETTIRIRAKSANL